MSHSEKLRGTYALPPKEYIRIRKAYIAKLNEIIEANYQMAHKAYTAVKALQGRSTPETIADAVRSCGLNRIDLLAKITKINVYSYEAISYLPQNNWRDTSEKFSRIEATKSDFFAPKRSDFKLLNITSKNFQSSSVPDYHFACEADNYVTFNDETKTVKIYIPEGNRSVDRTMEATSPVTIIMGFLRRAQWGTLKKYGGFTEYQSESDDEDKSIGAISFPNLGNVMGKAGEEALAHLHKTFRAHASR